MNLDPARAPRRTDLTFLSVRSSRAAAPVPPPAPSSPARPLLERPTATPAVPTGLEPPAPTPPARAAPAVRAAPIPSGSLLDLDGTPDEPEPTPTPGPGPGSRPRPPGGPAPTSGGSRTGAADAASAPVPPRLPRMPATGRVLLTPTSPVVALSRLTSGVGALRLEAAVTSGVGDLVLTCAYALTTGAASFMNPDDGQRTAPAGARVPLLVAGQDRFSRFVVDLRQVRRLARAVFLLHSRSGTPVPWAGAVVISTQSGARVDVPLESAPTAATLTAVSLYQVDGEIVLRAESEPAASPREACRSFGYDTIAWLDGAHAIV